MRKIGGIAMILIAVCFLALIVKAIVQLPESEQQLRDAVFVEDGVIHPENEGKRVIVFGEPVGEENARDDELSLTLPGAVAVRYVEAFAVHGVGEDREKDWTPLTETSTDWLKQRRLYGRVRLGEFEVDNELLLSFPAGRELTLQQLDADEVKALEAHVETVEAMGVLYFSEAPLSCFSGGSANDFDLDYEGYRRVHYRYMELKPGETCAVVGLQQGNRLVKDPDLGGNAYYENARSQEDVVHKSSMSTILGMVIVGIICLALIALGVIWIIR